ncbi:hypothetical protein GCM10027344_07080 [Spelaeicoccus albus]
MTIRPGRLLGTDTFARDVGGAVKHSLRLMFEVEAAAGELRAEVIDGVECLPRWVSLDELDSVPHLPVVEAGLRLRRDVLRQAPVEGKLHHVELWLEDFERDGAPWAWVLNELGYSVDAEWTNGVSYRLGGTYIVLETSPDIARQPHDRMRPGLNHLAFGVSSRERLDKLNEAAPLHGWAPLFAEKYPHAGGPRTYAAYWENSAGFEIELVAQ